MYLSRILFRVTFRMDRDGRTDHYDRMVVKPHMTDAQISRQLKDNAPSPARAFKPLIGLGIDLLLLMVLLGIGWRVIRYILGI